MIKCTVCLAENDNFAVTCVQCKAFLQDRVPNLNLFETGWRVLESPRKAFRTIVLAEHKNYGLFMFALFGVAFSFTGFWFFKLGNRFGSLIELIPAAVGFGVIIGLVSAVLISGIYFGLAKLLGGATGFRGSLALLAYSFTPITFSLFLVLPIELLTFGMYLFTRNPNPYDIKPVSYVVLLGFDSVVTLWTLILAVFATRVGHQLNFWKGALVVLGTLVLFGSCAYFAAAQLHLTDSL